jgi:hypothetical protein
MNTQLPHIEKIYQYAAAPSQIKPTTKDDRKATTTTNVTTIEEK